MCLKNPCMFELTKLVQIKVDYFTWTIEKTGTQPLVILDINGRHVEFKKVQNNVPAITVTAPNPVATRSSSGSGNHLVSFVESSATGCQLLENLTAKLLQILEVKDFGVYIHNSEMVDPDNFFIPKLMNKIAEVHLILDHSNDNKITAKLLEVLQNTMAIDYLKIEAASSFRGVYKGPLRNRSIALRDWGFISLAALLEMQCSKVKIERDSVNSKDLNLIMKRHLEGGLPNLKFFCMNFSHIHHPQKLYVGLTIRNTFSPCPSFFKLGLESWRANAKDLAKGPGKTPAVAALVERKFYFWIPEASSMNNDVTTIN